LDKELLASPDLGPTARGAGTTSNVLYFNGETVYIACSGDSRAIMGKRAGGKVSAFDLSKDHKPDLPDERKRIEKAGGVVSAAGPNGLPPSRVWVNGRVGLAMSRSIGDGEAKGHGVIPDPEVKVVTVKPAANATADGDAFVCVASDGIWEFISSQQACDVISKHPTARGACVELVNLAEQRWKEEEGSYRDDITCIIAYLPFLEDLGDENLDLIATGNAEAGAYFQQKSDLASASGAAADADDDDDGKGDDFVKRRLSVAGPPIDLDA
jgi:protein phosphatase 2C family protein 2/3